MLIPQKIQKYLAKQNHKNWNVELTSSKKYSNIVIIPALDEFDSIPQLIDSLKKNSKYYLERTLFLFVVNNLKSSSKQIKLNNQFTLKYLKNFFLDVSNLTINFGIIDASSNGKELPEKDGGVGFARKLGMDLALNYFDYTSNKKKIFISLDADCTVSSNYLELIVEEFNKNTYHAAVVNFEHTLPDDKIEKAAILNYELFLRYYVLGLKYAKSHYAYNWVGSTIVCDAESYINVGGMNKRKAGEDFYFLEKLAKIDEIHKLDGATVFPSARISSRVPFGTGQRVKRFTDQAQNEYLLYNSESFEILKNWLEIFQNSIFLSSNEYLKAAKSIHPLLFEYLQEQKFEDNWDKILSHSKSDKQINKQKILWMDGFRTLKLIHYLRDNGLPMKNTFREINTLLEKMQVEIDFKTKEDIPSIEGQLNYLQKMRGIT